MTSLLGRDEQWLLNCLTATLSIDHETRSFAEASLNQASLQLGFGAALAKITVNREFSLGLRQLAAVLLKQFIKQHWQEGEENFIHPVVSIEEKENIRNLLLTSLDDPHRKLCTAVGMAIASISHYDWPDDWPELLPHLLRLISYQPNMNGVRGGLRCLALISCDLDNTLAPTLVPMLFPTLHTIVSSPQIYDKSLRAKAISIVHSCTSVLGTMSGVYELEVQTLMKTIFKSWMEQFSTILQFPVQRDDFYDWSIRMEVLKCLIQFIQDFPSLIEAEFSIIMKPLWQTFVSCLEIYELSCIQGIGDPHMGSYDSEGAERSLEIFAIQLLEVLLTIVGRSKLRKVIRGNIRDLAYFTIGYLQITEDQVHTWSSDSNQYVADEDDTTYSCRVSGSFLLVEMVHNYGEEAIDAIIDAVQKRFNESCQSKMFGLEAWWKLREATIYALGCLPVTTFEIQVAGSKKIGLGNLLEQMLDNDIGLHEYPFLHARAFSTVGKFSSEVRPSLRDQILYAAMETITLDVPPPLKIGSCRALTHLLPDIKPQIMQTHIIRLFSSLGDLLKGASDETLHLVLETIQAAIRAGHEAIVSVEAVISPMILNLWLQHVSDPFICIDAIEVLEAIKNSPGCIWPLVCRILPSLGSILENYQHQSDGLVASSLDLITMLLKNSPVDIVKAIHDVCFYPTIHVVLQTEDYGVMQNATECLAAFVAGGKQHLIQWEREQGLAMKSLLRAASRLLDPNLESSASLFVGSYILQLLLHFPFHMAEHVRDLIAGVVRRLQSCQIAGLESSLLVVLSRLVHLSVPNVGQFIDCLINVPADGHASSLPYVMSKWTKQQSEIQGAYQIKVTITALALLLATQRVEMNEIYVHGHLIKSNSGILTRSKAKQAPDQWTLIPLPAKILSLLADMLIEIQDQNVIEDESSDWEEEISSRDILQPTASNSNEKLINEHLDVISEVLDGSNDDNYEDDLLKDDPLNEINVEKYIGDFIAEFYSSNGHFFEHLYPHLTQAQREAVQKVLKF